MQLRTTSNLKLIPLTIRKDQKNFIVEDPASGEFYEMPEICIDAIKLIQDGVSLGEIEEQLTIKYPDEDVNLLEFSGQLLEAGLVEEIDGLKIELAKKNQQVPGFQWIPQKVGKVFFNDITKVLYLLLFLVNLAIFFIHPELFPHYKDVFISKYMLFNIPAWLLITFVFVFIHEMGHVLAIRSYNQPTKLEIGHRLFLVVLETDMSSVWKLPSKDRNVLYLAGLCFDSVILFLALMGQLAFSQGPALFLGILRMIVLDTVLRMLYQLCIYMKTDLYYLFENSTGCYNLMENAQQAIRNLLSLKKSGPDEAVFEDERKTVLWYSIFYFAGVAISISLYILFYIPQLFFAIKKILPGFETSITGLPFWDSAAFTLQLLIGFLLLFYSWTKKYRRKIEL